MRADPLYSTRCTQPILQLTASCKYSTRLNSAGHAVEHNPKTHSEVEGDALHRRAARVLSRQLRVQRLEPRALLAAEGAARGRAEAQRPLQALVHTVVVGVDRQQLPARV